MTHIYPNLPFTKLVVLSLMATSLAFAQQAQIAGRVTDPTGAVVPDVKVTLINTATDVKRDTTTNNLGYYTVGLLTPGNYKIAVAKTGFRTLEQTGIVLEVDQHASLDFKMEVGQLTQTLSVEAAAPLVDSTEASVGQVISNTQVVELPLNGRNYVSLGLLSGGTVEPAAGSREQGFSSGGQRLSANNFLLDGVDNNSYELADAGRMSGIERRLIARVQVMN